MPPPSLTLVGDPEPGPNPFIATLVLAVPPPASSVTRVTFTVATKTGGTARPVSATYARVNLQSRGLIDAQAGTVSVPVFGLYAGRGVGNPNSVRVAYTYGSRTLTLTVPVATAAWGVTAFQPRVDVVPRNPAVRLGFSFFLLQAFAGSAGPVILDVDGEVRWAGTTGAHARSRFVDGAVLVGTQGSKLLRNQLDGTFADVANYAGEGYHFHRAIDAGKTGVLLSLDRYYDGARQRQSNIVEVNPATGAILPNRRWNLAQIISDHMAAGGDDPSGLVRTGPEPSDDWFHGNAACYWKARNELVVSSRENFVIGIGYDEQDPAKKIRWILGDPTKAWHAYASLAAKALTIPPGKGRYPIGQHSVSIAAGNRLLLFDNGAPSRASSAPRQYVINAARRTATEVWAFDHVPPVYSADCSSVYQSGGSYIVDYADQPTGDGGYVRLAGLDGQKRVGFEYTLGTGIDCTWGWNAQPVSLAGLVYDKAVPAPPPPPPVPREYPPAAMTGATTVFSGLAYGNGAYVASASSELGGGYGAVAAFDKVTDTYVGWGSSASYLGAYQGGVTTTTAALPYGGGAQTYAGEWLQLQLPAPLVLKAYTFHNQDPGALGNTPVDWVLLGSNTGGPGSWQLLDQRASYAWPARPGTFAVTNVTAYSHFRMVATRLAGESGSFVCKELLLWNAVPS